MIIDDIKEISRKLDRKIRIMEVCGTHTMAIRRFGIDKILPDNIELISGPGCPVCVTPVSIIDEGIFLLKNKNIILTLFGDMLRVPGSKTSIEKESSKNNNVKIIMNPFDNISLCRNNPEKEIVFFGIGFETTLPGIAQTLKEINKQGISNFSVIPSGKFIPPAMKVLVEDPKIKIDAFLCPGHVSVIIGSKPYEFISRDYKLPCVVSGFEADDILTSILMILEQITKNQSKTEIQYKRCVKESGNIKAREVMNEVFNAGVSDWRGIGNIPDSGTILSEDYKIFDAIKKFNITIKKEEVNSLCICGDVLKGISNPFDCKLFGKKCTPANPVGACMVSSEGSCAAYYKYGREK